MREREITPVAGRAPDEPQAARRQAGTPLAGENVPIPHGESAEAPFGLDADFEHWAGDVGAGGARVPGEWELEGPAVSISLGDASDLDPALLAAMCGPDGLGGEAPSAMFGQDRAGDALRPGPVLAALTEQAVSGLANLSDDQLTGALSAARRLENRAAYLQTVAIAEFARRREVRREEARSRKVPLHCRPGQFPGEELAPELVCTPNHADERIWQATDLTTRLPRTLAGMAAGTIDAARAYLIWSYTWSLRPRDAARADEVLAAAAPGLRPDQLARKAAALEMKLDPQAAKRRKEHARRDGQRVEVRHERSGNAMLAGRELDPVRALAAKANIDALAIQLRAVGREGSLQQLRAWIMTELLQGRNPLGRLASAGPADPPPAFSPPDGESGPGDIADHPADGPVCEDWPDDLGYRDEDVCPQDHSHHDEDDCPDGCGTETSSGRGRSGAEGGAAGEAGAGSPRHPESMPHGLAGGVAPPPALINVLVPAGTLLGWSASPAQAAGWGLLDEDETKAFVRAASLNARTRFCMTLIAPDGTALAHGCSRGQQPWLSDPAETARSAGPPGPEANPFIRAGTRGDPPPPSGPDPGQAQRLADLIRRLNVTFRPIAQDACDHGDAEDRYTPSRGLRHLIVARTATCTAPACNAQAIHCDLDHSVAYPDGATCQCNLAPKCRRHHRCKQAPGWRAEQVTPATHRWTVPSGRTYATTPTIYDL